MAHNNDALYDAVVAGAGGGAQHGWLVLSTPASYTPFATNIDILATAVDLQIPAIAGGASISQINLLQSITQSVLTARYPVPVAPATYVDIAKAIAAVYVELEKLLTNQPTVASYGVNWLVADWYIDGTVGDDANSGVVIGAPLKTGAELLRRLGPYAMWPQSVTVHVLANGMIDALVLRGLMMVAGTHLDVVGTPTQVADAGTVASFTALNHATPEATLITATGIADWTAHQWQRIRATAGANPDAVAWIARSNPSGLGVGTARISRPFATNLTSTTTLNTTVTLAVGVPIVVETLPLVPAACIEIDGSLLSAATPAWQRRQLAILDLDIRTLSVNGTAVDASGYAAIQRLRVNNVFLYTGNTNSSNISSLGGCEIYNREQANSIRAPDASLFNCLIGDPGNGTFVSTHAQCFGSNLLFQGTQALFASTVLVSIADIQVFDVASAVSGAITVQQGRISNCSGNGNAGYGYSIGNRSFLSLVGTQNLQGAVSNARLSAAPATNLTLPQFLQPSDYAQKGTATLVAGTTTVTVPWYDNTVQQVTVSHAVFGGTPGILSVQQISTTQFIITSSSALDTSTVRWSISPLGKNVFISTT